MITEVRMPKLGMAMKKGVVTKWKAGEREEVMEGDALLEIETEKVAATVPAPATGTLGRIVADPGTAVPVGGLLALIGKHGDTFPAREELSAAAAADTSGASALSRAPASSAPVRSEAPGPPRTGESPVSPAARRRAKELGIDVALVPPGAPGKRVTSDDVEAYAEAQPVAQATAAPPEVIPFAGIRATVAERMTDSLRTMAQVTVSREVDASGLVRRRAELAAGFEAATGVSLSYTDLLVETVAGLLPEHPLLGATLTDRGIEVSGAAHMGFAVALDDGLIVPVIRDAGARSLGEIARDRARLADKARAGTLGLDEIEGGTFTISNLGSYGADAFTPIVNPPQCAILGVGRIVDKPVVVDGEVTVRPMVWL
ncbi:MAG: dihydrolipoamide acetyltransferase family protein, partial [Streptosporangiaceae bacterium]